MEGLDVAKGFTVASIKALKNTKGRYGQKYTDPGCPGLCLWVRDDSEPFPTGRYWQLRFTWKGKPDTFSIGTCVEHGLADARAKVIELRAVINQGINPKAATAASKAAAPMIPQTFRDDALAYHAHKVGSWDALHAKYWLQTMERHVFGKLGKMETPKITVDDIVSVIEPIWKTKNATAIRLHGQIRATITHAMDLDDDDSRFGGKRNQAEKAIIRLPKGHTKPQEHHASICWQETPALYKRLTETDHQSAKALQFLLLTGAPRAAEVLAAKWSEIAGDVWHVPTDRLKSANPKGLDRPLTKAALDLLATINTKKDGYIFTGRKGKTVGDTFITFAGHMHRDGMQILLREELKLDCHVHGLRATFATWVQDNTTLATDWDASEINLDHQIANSVQRAYKRSDLLPERRALLERWVGYLTA